MRDWSRSESFDCIAFFAAAKGINNAEAIKTLAAHLGINTGQREARPPRPASQMPPPPKRPARITLDDFEPSDDDYAAILRTRKLPPEAESGLVLAHSVGVLRFATVGGFPSWIVTDQHRTIAEARRLDGHPFPAGGSLAERKAHTLRGSSKSWPVGLGIELRPESLRNVAVTLCEGGPDLLSAYAVVGAPQDAPNVHPCAMLGTGTNIGEEALAVLRGRHIIIIAHGDEAGREAAARWKDQLVAIGSPVRVRALPDHHDLNDLVSKHGLDGGRRVLLP